MPRVKAVHLILGALFPLLGPRALAEEFNDTLTIDNTSKQPWTVRVVPKGNRSPGSSIKYKNNGNDTVLSTFNQVVVPGNSRQAITITTNQSNYYVRLQLVDNKSNWEELAVENAPGQRRFSAPLIAEVSNTLSDPGFTSNKAAKAPFAFNAVTKKIVIQADVLSGSNQVNNHAAGDLVADDKARYSTYLFNQSTGSYSIQLTKVLDGAKGSGGDSKETTPPVQGRLILTDNDGKKVGEVGAGKEDPVPLPAGIFRMLWVPYPADDSKFQLFVSIFDQNNRECSFSLSENGGAASVDLAGEQIPAVAGNLKSGDPALKINVFAGGITLLKNQFPADFPRTGRDRRTTVVDPTATRPRSGVKP